MRSKTRGEAREELVKAGTQTDKTGHHTPTQSRNMTRKMVPITGRAHSLYFWSFQQKIVERRGDRTTDLSIYPRL